MATFLSIISLGFFLGMRHATDADHVIAVSTIVSRESSVKSAAWVGIVWGVGHTLTIMVVGGLIIGFKLVISPTLGLSLEMGVAFMLIILGLLNIDSFMQWFNRACSRGNHASSTYHSHVHRHGDYIHTHSHGHHPAKHGHKKEDTPPARLDRLFGNLKIYQVYRTTIIGIVHGLAGSAAVALMVLPIIPSPTLGILYLFIFGLGTIVGMMLITAAIAMPFKYSNRWSTTVNSYLKTAAGVFSLGFGLFLVYHIGFVQGLFTG